MGNGRCDSPGYNAKHGTHTIIDSERGMITDFHIFHVDLTGTSANVKLGGLNMFYNDSMITRLNCFFDHQKTQASSLLSKKESKDTRHQFDVWHHGKNMKKKLSKAGKKKYFPELWP